MPSGPLLAGSCGALGTGFLSMAGGVSMHHRGEARDLHSLDSENTHLGQVSKPLRATNRKIDSVSFQNTDYKGSRDGTTKERSARVLGASCLPRISSAQYGDEATRGGRRQAAGRGHSTTTNGRRPAASRPPRHCCHLKHLEICRWRAKKICRNL